MSATQQRSERRKELAARGNEMEQIEIKHLDGRVLYTHQPEDSSGLTMRHVLEAATKSGADLSRAVLSGADLRDADLREADLRYADLREADLRGADLRYADLREADLRYADLREADLSGADLRGADLSGAVLSDADLRYADLRYAVLSGADLRGADLSRAVLRGAKVYGVKITRSPVVIDGLRWVVTIIDGHIKIGCHLHAINAWSVFDDAAIAAMAGRDALRFWSKHKGAIMALAAPFASPAAADEVAA